MRAPVAVLGTTGMCRIYSEWTFRFLSNLRTIGLTIGRINEFSKRTICWRVTETSVAV